MKNVALYAVKKIHVVTETDAIEARINVAYTPKTQHVVTETDTIEA